MTTRLRTLLRLPFFVFVLLSSAFGLLSFIPFAYLQFLRHQLFEWLSVFVLFHHILYWAAFLPAMLSVADRLAEGRRATWVVIVVCALMGLWLAFNPLLPTLTSDGRSLFVALAVLAAPIAFAVLDHLDTRGRIGWDDLAPWGASDRKRAAALSAVTALYLWTTFTAVAGYRLFAGSAGPTSRADFALASLWSLALHLATASGMFAVLLGITAIRSARIRYLLSLACIAAVLAIVLVRVVFAPIAFRGAAATTVALVYGSAAAVLWSGVAHLRAADAIAGKPADRNTLAASMALVVFALVASVAIGMIRLMDWYFLLQKLIAFCVWVAGFAVIYGLVGARRQPSAAAAMIAAVAMVSGTLLAAGTQPSPRWVLAVDRYSPHDASLMLLRGTLAPRAGDLAEITRLLVAHSNVTQARPAEVLPADPRPTAASRPHIFLFVIDSLRRDYLSPYNPDVRFTPSIQAFADESLTFTRAFTRYSGTGLSEPAIWSGALLPHKEYVMPFAPMNALEKLLAAQRYRRLISVDQILAQLLTPSPDVYELDRGVQNRHYQLCRTLEELQAVLPDATRDGRPAFVFTQPQDVHLANVAIDPDARAGVAGGGFYRPYAARIQRLDACFGRFVKYLKETGLFANSVIIITSDHGDSLGDEGRWGHAYTVFPEVVRVPLIIHVPPALGDGVAVDTDAVAFTTDIVPTLYQLLGREPADRGPMFGLPLVGVRPAALAKRRQVSYLIASSYGPVYGVLERNAEALYIIDAINTAEHRYDLRQGLNGERVAVTDIDRNAAIEALRSQLLELSAFYHVKTNR